MLLVIQKKKGKHRNRQKYKMTEFQDVWLTCGHEKEKIKQIEIVTSEFSLVQSQQHVLV
jgi:hypothetical protein